MKTSARKPSAPAGGSTTRLIKHTRRAGFLSPVGHGESSRSICSGRLQSLMCTLWRAGSPQGHREAWEARNRLRNERRWVTAQKIVSRRSNWLGGSSFLTTGITFWEGVGCSTAGEHPASRPRSSLHRARADRSFALTKATLSYRFSWLSTDGRDPSGI
jgi:hypothetical protein